MTPALKRSCPLEWPPGRTRTLAWHVRRAPFGARTIPQAAAKLERELRLLGAQGARMTCNPPPRRDSKAQPQDRAVAVWFRLKGGELVLCCDTWDRVEDNVHAIALYIEATRGQARWKVASVEEALHGFLALPCAAPLWWQVLGVPAGASLAEAEAAYRERARHAHPDAAGGNADEMVALNAARDAARAQHRVRP